MDSKRIFEKTRIIWCRQYDEAKRHFQEALGIDSNAGLVAGIVGHRSNALHHLREAVRLRPGYREAAKELAELERQ